MVVVRVRNARGFTLIEVMVALAIIGVTMGAFLKAAGQNASNTGYLRDKTLAHWVAMNKMTEYHVLEQWPNVSRSNGVVTMAQRDWKWTVKITQTPDKDMRRIDIDVATNADPDQALSSLSGFIGRY